MHCSSRGSQLWAVVWLTVVFFFFVVEVSNLSKGGVNVYQKVMKLYLHVWKKREKDTNDNQKIPGWCLAGRSASAAWGVSPEHWGLPGDVPILPRWVSLVLWECLVSVSSSALGLCAEEFDCSKAPEELFPPLISLEGIAAYSGRQCPLSRVWLGAPVSPTWSKWRGHCHWCLCWCQILPGHRTSEPLCFS